VTAPKVVPGQVIGAQYAVQAVLQHHGLSVTYQALATPRRGVAVKVFDPELRLRAESIAFLDRTIAKTNALSSEVVAHIVDHGFDPEVGAPFTVTDLSAQPSLVQLVQSRPLSKSDASALLGKIAQTLQAAHAEGLSHLALKPANLFVGPAPVFELKIADFGASELRRALSADVLPVDAPWIAPEQLTGEGGPLSDLFSSGLVLFFAMTGRSYWRSCQTHIDVEAWKGEVRAPRSPASVRAAELGANLSAALDRVFERALAVDPSVRFRSIRDFALAVETAVSDAPASLPRGAAAMAFAESGAPTRTDSAPPSSRFFSRSVPVVAAIGLGLAIVAFAAIRLLRGAPSESTTAVLPPEALPSATAAGSAPVEPFAAGESSASAATTTVASAVPAPTASSSARASEPAQLTIRCRPDCEMVFVDNRKVDPYATVSVPAGTHIIAAGRTGYPAHTEKVTLAPGERHTTILALVQQRPAAAPKPSAPSKPCGKFLKRCD
jgi:hypothetical protein